VTWRQRSHVKGKKSMSLQSSKEQCLPRSGNSGVPILELKIIQSIFKSTYLYLYPFFFVSKVNYTLIREEKQRYMESGLCPWILVSRTFRPGTERKTEREREREREKERVLRLTDLEWSRTRKSP